MTPRPPEVLVRSDFFAFFMRSALLVLSLFGLLFLTSCGSVNMYVYRADNRKVGEIRFDDEKKAMILDEKGQTQGSVDGTSILKADGSKAGSVKTENDHVVILDAKDAEVGSLEKGMDCYGKSNRVIGRISTEIDTEAAAGACLLLLLQ